MKKRLLTCLSLCIFCIGFTQSSDTFKVDSQKLLSDTAKTPCSCMENIETRDKKRADLNKEINECIKPSVLTLMMTSKLAKTYGTTAKEITVNANENSAEYKTAFNDLRDHLLENCEKMKELMSAIDEYSENSITNNALALEFYHACNKESEKQNWEEAIKHYQLAVKKDPKFAFAWDNLGLSYRRLEKYDLAINAYQNSLKVDPKGRMPLQNMAITYIYSEKYKKAVRAYENFGKLYPDDPEVYYGLGQLYFNNIIDYEKSLDNICRAYLLYKQTESPYLSHAEDHIRQLYNAMKKENKLDTFHRILKKNNINYNI